MTTTRNAEVTITADVGPFIAAMTSAALAADRLAAGMAALASVMATTGHEFTRIAELAAWRRRRLYAGTAHLPAWHRRLLIRTRRRQDLHP